MLRKKTAQGKRNGQHYMKSHIATAKKTVWEPLTEVTVDLTFEGEEVPSHAEEARLAQTSSTAQWLGG